MTTRIDNKAITNIPISRAGIASLEQEYELGEIVSVEQGDGVIAAFVEENFEFPKETTGDDEDGPEMEEIDASSENPVYIIALQDGGSVAATADEISGDGTLSGDGKDIESWDDVQKDADEVEMSRVYDYCEGAPSLAELESAKRRYICDNYQAELAQYAVEELGDEEYVNWEQMSSEELVNIRGIDDPHIGFDSMPNGWTRKSVLQAWASLGGMWRTCYPRMIREFGPNGAKRFCAALKDEVLQTEMWRSRF